MDTHRGLLKVGFCAINIRFGQPSLYRSNLINNMMSVLKSIWNKCTNTVALQLASGELEKYFFESVYRIVYVTGHSAYDRRIPYLIYSSTVRTLLVLLFVCELWELFCTTWTIDIITDIVNVIFIQSGAFFKYWTMRKNRAFFNDLASSMESPDFDITTKQRKKILEIWHKRSEDSLKLLLFLGTGTITAWHIYPLVDDLDYNLMVVVKLPFKYDTNIRYTFVYMTTLIVFSYASYSVMTHDLLVQTYIMHLLCQYAVLNDCFRNIMGDCKIYVDAAVDEKVAHLNVNFRRVYIKRFGNLVNQHNLILKNTTRLRDIMSVPMLVQLGFSTTLFCSIGFKVATSVSINLTKWFMSLLYLAYNMSVQYVICRWCEEIKIQGETIGESVYCSGWETGMVMVPGVRTSILLILARTNKPVALSAGGIYDLTLRAYAQMVKTSYSALTVLLQLR